MTSVADRPSGVTAMAVIAAGAGIIDIAAGLGDIAIGGGFWTDQGFGTGLDGAMTVVGVILLVVGALGVATGFGLWQGRNWAWLIARLWASLCIIAGLVGAGLAILGGTLTSEILATIIGSAVPAVGAAVVLWYLYQPQVKAAFGRA